LKLKSYNFPSFSYLPQPRPQNQFSTSHFLSVFLCRCPCRRREESPLDLNNLPEDFTCRDGKQVTEDSSSSAVGICVAGLRKKKSGANKDGKDECGKVYECRFCSLKFCKSQALGERETETLNRARQLVFSNDNLAAHHLGIGQIPHGSGGYPQAGNMGEPSLTFRPVYPTRMFSGSSSTTILPPPPPPPPPPPHQPYMYTSPSRLVSYPHPPNDYFVGHVLSGAAHYAAAPLPENNYTCIGAPVGPAFSTASGGSVGGGGGRDIDGGNHGTNGLLRGGTS
ncbi:hypothetical protein NMG60_11018953, partial [Bertholletia excelsa]